MLNLAIIGHWIDDKWKLHEALMEFEYVEGHHYSEILGKKIYDVLKEYDICQKLFCITADGASNNSTMCEEIERLLSEDGISWSADHQLGSSGFSEEYQSNQDKHEWLRFCRGRYGARGATSRGICFGII